MYEEGPNQWARDQAKKATLREFYRRAKSSATQAGVAFLLTFEQYAAWWLDDERWDRRTVEGLTMARIDKRDGFTLTNIECRTRAEDLAHQARKFSDGRQRRVMVGARTFNSVNEAAAAMKVSHQVASYRAKHRVDTLKGRWAYLDEIEAEGL